MSTPLSPSVKLPKNDNLRQEVAKLQQQLAEVEAEKSQLIRENKVLKTQNQKLEEQASKKANKLTKEVSSRLKANQEKYAMEQTLNDLQKRLRAQLEKYNIDLSKSATIEDALSNALDAISTLSMELDHRDKMLLQYEKTAQEYSKLQENNKMYQQKVEQILNVVKEQDKLYQNKLNKHQILFQKKKRC